MIGHKAKSTNSFFFFSTNVSKKTMRILNRRWHEFTDERMAANVGHTKGINSKPLCDTSKLQIMNLCVFCLYSMCKRREWIKCIRYEYNNNCTNRRDSRYRYTLVVVVWGDSPLAFLTTNMNVSSKILRGKLNSTYLKAGNVINSIANKLVCTGMV